jgi:hypothetical protein
LFYKLVVHLNCRSFYKVRDKKKNTKIIEGSMNYRKLRFKKRLSKPTRYSHLFNKRGAWNKRGGGAKDGKLLNVELGINVEGGIFGKN